MNARCSHYTPLVSKVLCRLVLCALAGCWEEVEYTPPAGEDEPAVPRAAPDHADEGAQDFADDLATSLANDTADTPPGEAASAAAYAEETDAAPRFTDPPPVTTERDAETATDTTPVDPDDRYALPPTDVEAEPTDPGDLLFGDDRNAEPPDDVPPVATDPSTATAGSDQPAVSRPAPPVTRPIEPAAVASRKTRRIAWLLGSKLSLAALADNRGADPGEVAKWFGQSQSLAGLLDTALAELPPRPDAPDATNDPHRALDYLFSEGQRLGRHLAGRFGDDHAALFELAVKSNILLALYRPRGPVVDALRDALVESGRRANLPSDLTRPLVELLADGATETAVQEAVFQLHADVGQHLTPTP